MHHLTMRTRCESCLMSLVSQMKLHVPSSGGGAAACGGVIGGEDNNEVERDGHLSNSLDILPNFTL
jgi:hypothetical protein